MIESELTTIISTADGQEIKLLSPANSMQEIEAAANSASDGLGLLSTDFIYCDRTDLPTEDEQFEFLVQASRIMGNRPVTVRALNLKPAEIPALQSQGLPDQCRGVRLGLAVPEILKSQLRALFRANTLGSFRLMLPMVSDVSELLAVKTIINEVQSELAGSNQAYDPHVELGIEVEIPAAVVLAQVLSFEISFFTISERLKQNSLVLADNNSLYTGNLMHDYSPSFLFQISSLAEEVRKRRKDVSVAAPLAGAPPAIPILIAMGVNELVMPPGQIPRAKQLIAKLTIPKTKLVASKAISFRTPEEIQQYAEESLPRLLK